MLGWIAQVSLIVAVKHNITSTTAHLAYSLMAAKSGSSGILLDRSVMQLVMPSKVGASMMI